MNAQRILLVSQSDSGGGAARAALRLHRALQAQGVDTAMLLRRASSGEPGLHGPQGRIAAGLSGLRSPLGRALMRMQRAAIPTPRSGNFVPSRWARRIDTLGPDVVHLHWVGDETLSIEDIGRIRQPLVWTLHDMWAFCGSEHVQPDSQRWSARLLAPEPPSRRPRAGSWTGRRGNANGEPGSGRCASSRRARGWPNACRAAHCSVTSPWR